MNGCTAASVCVHGWDLEGSTGMHKLLLLLLLRVWCLFTPKIDVCILCAVCIAWLQVERLPPLDAWSRFQGLGFRVLGFRFSLPPLDAWSLPLLRFFHNLNPQLACCCLTLSPPPCLTAAACGHGELMSRRTQHVELRAVGWWLWCRLHEPCWICGWHVTVGLA